MEFDAGYLARGSKVEVIDPRRIDQIASTCECEREERRNARTSTYCCTPRGNKIAMAQVIDN